VYKITRAFKICLAISLICAPAISSAHDPNSVITGNQLIATCNNKEYQEHSALWTTCLTYVYALNEGWTYGSLAAIAFDHKTDIVRKTFSEARIIKLSNTILGFCTPDNVTNEQSALVVTKYLQDHPEKLNEEDGSLVLDAFRAAWPCPSEK